MEIHVRDSSESVAKAQFINETLLQLEAAKEIVKAIRSDEIGGNKEKICSMKSEIEELKAALQVAEIRYNEERRRSVVEIKSAYELIEQMKKFSSGNLRVEIEELKSKLMDKETELQCIRNENEILTVRLENMKSGEQKKRALEQELQKSKDDIENMKVNLVHKETELQKISEENKMLNAELEAELRRQKVHSEQWRKAAEAAIAMLSAGNNGRFMNRSGSMDSQYWHKYDKMISPPFSDEDLAKRKNANVLRRIGISWKKAPK